ncbi:MAG: Uma2 family endonuclease [Candidatus Tectomicrobia bacterium]|nr:Uma2 family endonuclease [Candidatus Tectomicrobia bacterium]
MATLIRPTEHPVLLGDVSWATYEALLVDGDDHRTTRIAYDQGLLEIMTPSFEHEHVKAIAQAIVETILDSRGHDYVPAGSTTFRRVGAGRGFEADASYYIERAAQVRGLTRIDLDRDPPPDLVIEIDLTHMSLDKFPIYAGLGVPEVWRFRGPQALIYRLVEADYVEIEVSEVVPELTSRQLTDFIQAGLQQTRPVWRRQMQAWAEPH